MRLFVVQANGKKKYLPFTYKTREEMAAKLQKAFLTIDGKTYPISAIKAEVDIDKTAVGMAAGGVLGVAGGPLGVFFGGIIGGLVGKGSGAEEESAVANFNKSLAG